MTELLCLSCINYDPVKEYCERIQTIIPCTDESGTLSSCMHHQKLNVDQKGVPVQIFWGSNSAGDDQYYLCTRCSTWWKKSQGHYCTGIEVAKPDIKDFINEEEMIIP